MLLKNQRTVRLSFLTFPHGSHIAPYGGGCNFASESKG